MFFYSIYKIYDTYQRYQEIFPGDIVGPIVMIFSYFLNGIVIILERRLDIHTSVLLFYFWLVHFLLNIPSLVKNVENHVDINSNDGSGTRVSGFGSAVKK